MQTPSLCGVDSVTPPLRTNSFVPVSLCSNRVVRSLASSRCAEFRVVPGVAPSSSRRASRRCQSHRVELRCIVQSPASIRVVSRRRVVRRRVVASCVESRRDSCVVHRVGVSLVGSSRLFFSLRLCFFFFCRNFL